MSAMKVLAWIVVPIVVTLIAWVVYRIAHRPAAPLTMQESMSEHQRLLQVLETAEPKGPAGGRRASRAGTRR
jgi:hypothetical protein